MSPDEAPPTRKPRGRPATTARFKKHVSLFKNVHVTYKKKHEVVESFVAEGMSRTLARHFGHLHGTSLDSARKKVYKWVQQRDLILAKATNTRTANHKCARELGMATTLPREVEEQLARWVSSMRKDGVPVTPHMLQIMALEAAIDLGLSEDQFYASWHWMQGFKKRFGLSLRSRTRTGQDTRSS
ncbi:hypothetical protein DYB32_005395 [Aphanomyces invadans]|uniref:HTH CENPB-type domain-containing protein n=1 Tax=Aphanomyces invadans TaxID=157072 RepID=A0A3R6ZPL1_9STRA|nr:hypothetical protein DYB32_005395 [Aphanomyces invadans]